jgi:hypothetical protein
MFDTQNHCNLFHKILFCQRPAVTVYLQIITMGSLNISTLPWTHPTIFSRYDYMGPLLFYFNQQSTLLQLTYIGNKSCWQVVYIYLIHSEFQCCVSASLDGDLGLFFIDADPDPTFHVDKDPNPDPAPHRSDLNLQPLVYRLSTSLLCVSKAPVVPIWVSTAPEFWIWCGSRSASGSCFNRIRFFNLIRIWIHVDPDPDLQRCWIQC